MSVTVEKALVGRIREHPGSILVQVRDSSDPVAAADALEAARRDISALDGGPDSVFGLGEEDRNSPKWVSGVTPTPDGPFVTVDGGSVPHRLLREVPEIVARLLREKGVQDALVGTPPRPGPLVRLPELPSAVLLRLFGDPERALYEPVPVPEAWLSAAVGWLGEGLGEDEEILGQAVAAPFVVRLRDAASLLESWVEARTILGQLVSGDQDTKIRAVNACFHGSGGNSCLALAGGGPEASSEDLVSTAAALVELARGVAPEVSYAYVSFEPTFLNQASSTPATEWSRMHGGAQPGRVEYHCDELVIDAFAYQILGTGHLARLGRAPAGAQELAGARVEVPIGDLDEWLLDTSVSLADRPFDLAPHRRNPNVQAHARRLLAPCLLKERDPFPEPRRRNDALG